MKTNVESRVFSITTLSATLPGAEGGKAEETRLVTLAQLRASAAPPPGPSLRLQESIDLMLDGREDDAGAQERAHLHRSW